MTFEANQPQAEAVVPAAPTQPQDGQAQQENTPQQDSEQGDSQEQNGQETQEKQSEKKRDEISPRALKAINRATAEKHKARIEAELLRNEVQELKRRFESQQAPTDQQRQAPEEEADPKVIAAQMREIERVNERSNEVLKKATKADPAFMQKVQLVNVHAPLFDDRSGLPTVFGQAFLDADEPHLLAAYFSENPDVAEELAALHPVSVGRRIERIESEVRAANKKQISSAPKPLEPVRGSARGSGEPDAKKDAIAWINWRNEQERKR